MPRTKKTETETLVPAEPKKRRSAAAPKTTAVKHTHTTKKPVPQEVDAAVSMAPAQAVTHVVAHTVTHVVTHVVTHEDVAKLAYSSWEARGCQGGSPQDDWLRAEQQLKG